MHPVSLSRFKAQAREAGAAALMPKRLGPKGPSKLTAQLEKQIRELAGQELSCRAIAKRLCRGKRKISYGLVASVTETGTISGSSAACHGVACSESGGK